MQAEDPRLQAFETDERGPGETVLAWVLASADGADGVVILTDRRLCLVLADEVEWVPVDGATLRYAPASDGEALHAAFETDEGGLAFTVPGSKEQAQLSNLLGNLAELREARARLEQAGLDPLFVSPPAEAGGEGISAVYQLIRLKQLLNRGILGETEFAMHRVLMIDGFRRQGAERP